MPSVSNPAPTTSSSYMLLDSKKEQAKKLFHEIDVNHDGTLSKEELFNALRKLQLPTSKSSFDKFFRRIDTDRNEVIDENEFETFVVERYRVLEQAFDRLLIHQQNQQQNQQNQQQQSRATTAASSPVNSVPPTPSNNLNNNNSFNLSTTQTPYNSPATSFRFNTTSSNVKEEGDENNNNNDEKELSSSLSAIDASPSPSPSPSRKHSTVTAVLAENTNNNTTSSKSPSPSLNRSSLNADAFRLAALQSGVILSDSDLRNIMDHMDTAKNDVVSFQEFVDYMLLCPCEVNPNAFFDSWYTDAFVDDGQSDFTFPREIRTIPSGGFFMSGGELEMHVEQPGAPSTSSSSTTTKSPFTLSSLLPSSFMKSSQKPEGKSTIKKSQEEGEQKQQDQQETTTATLKSETSPVVPALSSSSAIPQPPSFAELVAKKLLFGGISGCLSRSLTAPIDRVRIMMVTAPHHISIASAIQKSLDGGVKSLWRGNGTNCLKITPEMAIKLLTFDILKKKLARDPGNITFTERLLSGAAAGLASQTTVYPLDLIRTRMAIAPTDKPYKSILDCARQTYLSSSPTNPSLKIFYAGIVPSVCGIVPYAGIDLSLNSYLKDMASDYLKSQNREVSVPLLLSCGMVSSSVATVCTFPLNVIRTKAQASGAPVLQIIKGMFTNVDSRTGLKPSPYIVMRRLYVGMLPALSKVAPATSLSYASYDFLGRRWK